MNNTIKPGNKGQGWNKDPAPGVIAADGHGGLARARMPRYYDGGVWPDLSTATWVGLSSPG